MYEPEIYCLMQTNEVYFMLLFCFVRVYEPEFYRLMQTNVGHTDAVRNVIHIKERSQVIT